MKVKEIMTKEIESLRPEESALNALNLLFKKEISGLPVVNTEGNLVGMFTEKNILKYILPSYIEKVGRFVYEENPKSIKKKFQDLVNLKVSSLMRCNVVTTDEETSLCEVAHLMLTMRVRRILVLDREKKVVGIVVREDILKAYAKEAGWERE